MKSLFIVGAQRSGSTYLYKVLDAHPEIFMAKPLRPEPKFFMNSDNFEMGKGFYEKKYFSDCTQKHEYRGEKSTSYIEKCIVAERIHAFYPNAKILVILRNPMERAYSNYRFSVDHGVETLSFSDAITLEKERLGSCEHTSSVNPYAYQARGHYINYLQEYLKVFDRSQIHIMIFEEFVGNLNAISALYSFLGVNKNIVPEKYKLRVNSSNVEGLNELEKNSTQLFECFDASIHELECLLGRNLDIWRV